MKTLHKSSWLHVENRKVLFLRNKGNETFYSPGGKREKGETDVEAVIREVKEEVVVDLIPETVKEVMAFEAEAHNQPVPTKLVMKCYMAEFTGTITPSREIEELTWYTHADKEKTSEAGAKILDWLKEQDRID